MINPSTLPLFLRQETPVANGRFEIRFKIPADLPYFEGHFPENPVLPGVAMIDIAIEAIRQNGESPRPLIGVKSAKYLGLVKPGDEIKMEGSFLNESDWQVLWFMDDKKVCDLVLSFANRA